MPDKMIKRGGMSDSGYGGDIPSPRQRGAMPSRRPSMEGGDRMSREQIATLRALLGQLEGSSPRVRDMPDMTPEEMAPYNRPADDINDAFFGPNRQTPQIPGLEWLMSRMQGGGR